MNKQPIKPNYGIDAPKVIGICGLITLLLLSCIFAAYYFLYAGFPVLTWFVIISFAISAFFTLYPVITILMGSWFLKFRERDRLLKLLPIKGNEYILDVGCGRGLLLISAAKKLTAGRVIGIDIWSTDQLSNSPNATLQNANIEGVLDKIEVITADARKMPFDSALFDIVISSWAIHNISDKQERTKALFEIMRVLKPGGTVALMDIKTFNEYQLFFEKNKFKNIELIGPHYTFGNPTYIVRASN